MLQDQIACTAKVARIRGLPSAGWVTTGRQTGRLLGKLQMGLGGGEVTQTAGAAKGQPEAENCLKRRGGPRGGLGKLSRVCQAGEKWALDGHDVV